MGRELSGVVACFQQIEIAAGRLGKVPDLAGSEHLGNIQGTIRGFFLEPSADRGRQLDAMLDDLEEECGEGRSVLTETVEVDKLQTTLGALHLELKEVLEDLGG